MTGVAVARHAQPLQGGLDRLQFGPQSSACRARLDSRRASSFQCRAVFRHIASSALMPAHGLRLVVMIHAPASFKNRGTVGNKGNRFSMVMVAYPSCGPAGPGPASLPPPPRQRDRGTHPIGWSPVGPGILPLEAGPVPQKSRLVPRSRLCRLILIRLFVKAQDNGVR